MKASNSDAWPNGQRKHQGVIVGDMIEWTEWFDTGLIKSKGKYDSKSRRQGYWEFNYPSGRQRAAGVFADDIPHGPWVLTELNGYRQRVEYGDGRLYVTPSVPTDSARSTPKTPASSFPVAPGQPKSGGLDRVWAWVQAHPAYSIIGASLLMLLLSLAFRRRAHDSAPPTYEPVAIDRSGNQAGYADETSVSYHNQGAIGYKDIWPLVKMCRVLLLKYRTLEDEVYDLVVEPYTQDNKFLYAWSRTGGGPRTYHRSSVEAWTASPETFERQRDVYLYFKNERVPKGYEALEWDEWLARGAD